MEVYFHKSFLKAYSKRIKGNKVLEKEFLRKLEIFIINPSEPALKTHKLSGILKDLHSFSIHLIVEFYFISQNLSPKKQFL
jgi:mRNA-degrading endonuclease YafQ of YafQ-DinJ toxin-antitoxin module